MVILFLNINRMRILLYKRLDSTYQACLDVRANTIVGNGYEIRHKDIKDTSQLMGTFIREPNANIGETFTSILKNMFIDLDTFYNGYIEFVKSGSARGIILCSSKNMFIRPIKRMELFRGRLTSM